MGQRIAYRWKLFSLLFVLLILVLSVVIAKDGHLCLHLAHLHAVVVPVEVVAVAAATAKQKLKILQDKVR